MQDRRDSLIRPVADAMKRSRRDSGLTQKALAVKAGVSLSLIVAIENYKVMPSFATIAAVAIACETKASSLIESAGL